MKPCESVDGYAGRRPAGLGCGGTSAPYGSICSENLGDPAGVTPTSGKRRPTGIASSTEPQRSKRRHAHANLQGRSAQKAFSKPGAGREVIQMRIHGAARAHLPP